MFSKRVVIAIGIIFLIIVNIVIIFLSSKKPGNFNSTFNLVNTVFVSAQSGANHISTSVRNIINSYIFLVNTEKENKKLRRRIQVLQQYNNQCIETEFENLRLSALLGLKSKLKHKMIHAKVVAKGGESWFGSVIISKGKNDGIKVKMPVLNADGIVGQIINTGINYSKVLLITDPNSSVDALIQRTRARGILQGAFSNKCSLKYVYADENVQIGDKIISSGLDGIYPKGILLGKVVQVVKIKPYDSLFQKIIVEPSADLQKLEVVSVIQDQIEKYDEMDEQ